jgi:hypothetical protein
VTFKGKVKSPETDCERGRKVTLKKKKKGPDATAGSSVSRRNGGWSVREPRAKGRYYALVAKQKVGTTTCGRAESRTIKP